VYQDHAAGVNDSLTHVLTVSLIYVLSDSLTHLLTASAWGWREDAYPALNLIRYTHPSDKDLLLGTPERKKPLGLVLPVYGNSEKCYQRSAARNSTHV
jgi:hypothetical protein